MTQLQGGRTPPQNIEYQRINAEYTIGIGIYYGINNGKKPLFSSIGSGMLHAIPSAFSKQPPEWN
jgi:hypothetical protein